MPKARTNIVGKRFGRLEVLSLDHTEKQANGNTRVFWKCRCDCGREHVSRSDQLHEKHVGCGCVPSATTHGMKSRSEYRIWIGIKSRCFNSKVKEYPRYGGRGITMCPEWRESFEAFIRDVGQRPSMDHEIDRYPNNDGNYEPGNVRWAVRVQQARNQSNNRRFELNGESLTLSELSERSGIRADTIRHRLKKGMSIEEAVATPVNQSKSHAA